MNLFKWMFIAGMLLLLAPAVWAQQSAAGTDSLIRHLDGQFWKAYNSCDMQGMAGFFTDDVEFYHDKGGIMLGKEALMAAVKKGMCGNPDYQLRREAIDKTVQVFPMYRNGQLYGALISGEHLFYITNKGKPEYLDGHARFTQLWVQQQDGWKMSRVLSYDHKPPMPGGR